MTVYNGDVNVNPDLLKLGIKRMEELISVCANFNRTIVQLTDTIKDLQVENKELKEIIKQLSGMVQKEGVKDFVDVETEGHDFRLFEDVFKTKLSSRSFNGLIFAGVRVLADFEYISEKSIRKIRNLGNRSVDEILSVFKEEGVQLADASVPVDYNEFVEGDHVVSICNFENVHKGDVLTVLKNCDCYSRRGFKLPFWPCKKDVDGKTVYLNISMIRKV